MPLFPPGPANNGAANPRIAARVPGWLRLPCTAAGWGIAGAVAAGGSWAVGLVIGRVLLGFALLAVALEGQVIETALAMAAICGGCGLLVGAAAWLLRSRTNRVTAALAGCIGGGITGVIGGALSPPLVVALAGVLPPELSSAMAWAVAGLLAGLVGYETSRERSLTHEAGSLQTICSAVVWGIAGAAALSGGGALGWLAARFYIGAEALSAEPDVPLIEIVLLVAGVGAGYGLIVGLLAGLVLGGISRARVAVGWGLSATCIGAIAGGLIPLSFVLGAGVLLPEASAALALAATGLLAGLAGYGWSRQPTPEEPETDEDTAQPGRKRPTRMGPASRLLPVVAVAGAACLWPSSPRRRTWAGRFSPSGCWGWRRPGR
ncbi:MAG TPA: hypothetical protein VKE74_26885 [Gemmataceae bacterium]|nr:hypothetical protein [Gemmataceae bacterium]